MANVAIEQWPTDTMPIKVFSSVYSVKTETIHSWISRGRNPEWKGARGWTEGKEYCKSPTGGIHVILEGYDQWVQSNTPQALGRTVTEFKSGSSKKGGKVTSMKRSPGSPPLLT